MTDLDRAIAGLCDAYTTACLHDWDVDRDAVAKVLAALDAARGEAVLEIVGGEDGWRGTWEHQPLSEFDVGTKLYAAPTAAQAEPLFLLHTGTVYGNERGDWEVEANSGKAVDAYCDANPGKTVGLYLATQAPPAALAVPAANVTPMRQPRADLARLVESINAAVYANGDGLSVAEAIGALELAKLELLKEQEQ